MAYTEKNAVDTALSLPKSEAFIKDLETALGQNKSVVTIAVADLDKFLAVNRKFGSTEGDRILIATGAYLRAGLPKGAALYRFAGDEFALLFAPGFEKEEAFLFAETLRRGYAVHDPGGESVHMTFAIASAPEDGSRAAELQRKAEGAMFRGKAAGGDRVCLAREEKMITKTSHYTSDQLQRLTKLSEREGVGEAVLLREALDALLRKYDV